MAKWEEKIKKDYEEIIKQNNLSKLNFSVWIANRFVAYFSLFQTPVIWVLCLALMFSSEYRWIAIWICLPIGVIFSILLMWSFMTRSKIARIKSKIINSLDFPYYYTLAFKELTNDKYQLTSLTTAFDVEPVKFLPQSGKNNTDEILNFICEGVKYSFGTITNEKNTITYGYEYNYNHNTGLRSSRTKRHNYSYTRYYYLNLCLLQDTII